MIKVQVLYEVNSKAQTVYKIFKPKEVVEAEEFDLEFTFLNLGERFEGGSFDLAFRYPDTLYPQGKIQIPSMDEKQTITVKVEDLVAVESGICHLMFQEQEHRTRDGTMDRTPFLSAFSGRLIGQQGFLPLPVSSKEEIYQKYSLVVAVIAFFTSLVALILAAIDLLASMF